MKYGSRIIVEGKTYISIAEAARAYKMDRNTIYGRLNAGRTIEESFGLRSFNYKGKPIEIICDGEIYKSYAALAKAYNLNVTTVSNRITYNGWTPEQAVLKKSVIRKTTGHKIVVAGKTYSSQKKAAEAYGLDHRTVWMRLQAGRTIEEAFGLKDFDYSSKPKKFNIDGKDFSSLRDACRYYSVDKYVLNARINKYGWTLREALGIDKRPGYEKGVAGIIYLIINKVSGKSYVGITMGKLESRWEQHIQKAFSEKKLDKNSIHTAIKKDNPDNFTIERIDDASSVGELCDKEVEWIKYHKSQFPKGYNLNAGGGSTRTTGKRIIVGEKSFKSITAACKYHDKEDLRREITNRLKLGWTPEEAFGLVEKEGYNFRSHIKVKVNEINFETLTAAALHFGINPKTANQRFTNMNWTIEETLELKEREEYSNWNKITYDGKTYNSETELREKFKIGRSAYYARKKRGLSISERLNQDNKNHIKITFRGKKYTSETELCNEFNVKRATYNGRKRSGKSISERLGFKNK